MLRRILIAVVSALVIAGCGGSTTDSTQDFEGTEQEVAQAIEDLEEAGQEDEPRRICQALLAKDVVASIEGSGGDCVEVVEKALEQTDTFALTVESVRVTGDTARARVETGVDEEKVETIELVREDDAWKISKLPGA